MLLNKQYRKLADRHLSERKHCLLQIKEEKAALALAEQHCIDLDAAQKILQEVAEKIQQQVHERISTVVTKCLETVFDEPYQFKILFEQKRGRTEARMVFTRDENELDPKQIEGGVKVIAAFALRLACLMLRRPASRPFLCLDEPFAGIWIGYLERLRDLIQSLAEDMGVQFLIVTHIEEMMIGKVIDLNVKEKQNV